MERGSAQPAVSRKPAATLCGVIITAFALGANHVNAAAADLDAPRPLNPKLLNLTPNKWVKFYQPATADWRRQGHAGIAYDSKRGILLLFGSDTHGRNWDNSVHAFDPVTEQWTTYYAPAPKETYRADDQGRAIAGTDRLLPWAMHTYDNVEYDPKLDALVVTALPEHNPIKKRIPQARVHPTWLYDLRTRNWRILPNNGKPYPKFFAAASAYDEQRDVLVAYKWGIWELGPLRDEWRKVTAEGHHKMHYTMVYDPWRHNLAVFGDYGGTNAVWIYTPGTLAGVPGHWQEKPPGGDPAPRGERFPAAFDREHGVFLLVVDNRPEVVDKHGRRRLGQARSAWTLIYDPDANTYRRLPQADMPRLRMNYMLVYDRFHKVFLLVTGRHSKPATVWALRLDMKRLR